MTGKRTLWQLFSSYLIITLVALVALSYFTFKSHTNSYLRQVQNDLRASAALARDRFEPLVTNPIPADSVDALCKQLGSASGIRLTVIAADGRVLGDSDEEPFVMDNHGSRPEVLKALAGRDGFAVRFSRTLSQTMTYVALPMQSDTGVAAVLRASVPITWIEKAQRAFYYKTGVGGAVVAAIAAVVSLFLARRISQPLEVLKSGAENFALGRFDDPLQVSSTLELTGLAEAMNQMASQLKARILTIEGQRYELEALLASMAEGVIAVDKDSRVLSFNGAAADMFNLRGELVLGQPIGGLAVNAEIKAIIEETLREEKSLEAEFDTDRATPRYLAAHSSPWTSAEGQVLGGVVVIADVTRLRRLEKVREEFVANVSHELKTPITAIKGYVETLMDAAAVDGKEQRKFLKIVRKQSDRLNAIIDDLLTLSRIEHGEDRFRLEPGDVCEVIAAAVDTCRHLADKRKVAMVVENGPPIIARNNPALLEQAVVNLVDNAIKYSSKGGCVRISAIPRATEIAIQVRDFGVGIPEKHLPRLFERFYRVDKARSRKLGGTGLGLAITKHIAKIHGGSVSVSSRVGEGSEFTFTLPAEQGEPGNGAES